MVLQAVMLMLQVPTETVDVPYLVEGVLKFGGVLLELFLRFLEVLLRLGH